MRSIFFFLVVIFTAKSSVGLAFAGEEPLTFGQAEQVFDLEDIVDKEGFLPNSTGAAWRRVETGLNALSAKFPIVANNLRSYFLDGETAWYWIDVGLHEAKPISPQVVLKYRGEQIAHNSKNEILIRRHTWEHVSENLKANVLLNLCLWSALGNQHQGDAATLSRVASYILHPAMPTWSKDKVYAFLSANLPRESQLYQRLAFEYKSASSPGNFMVRDFDNGDAFIEVLVGDLRGLRVTPIRPNRRFKAVGTHNTINSPSLSFKSAEQPNVQESEICGGMNYAGSENWRLPTPSEARVLVRNLGLYSASNWRQKLFEKTTTEIWSRQFSRLFNFFEDDDIYSKRNSADLLLTNRGLMCLQPKGWHLDNFEPSLSATCDDHLNRVLERPSTHQTVWREYATDIAYFCVN